MTSTPIHAEYRCEGGHTFYAEGKGNHAPEILPCPHVLEPSQDHCPKEGRRFHGRSDRRLY